MIFCIGHSKTGTRSLAKALEVLGYSVCHGSYETNLLLEDSGLDSKYLTCDAYADIPVIRSNWPIFAKQYLQSRFIYTYRDNQSWVDSRLRHIAAHPKTRTWGWFDQTPEQWIRDKETLEARILKYFDERLLWLNLFAGHGWEKLCGFTGDGIPKQPFPHIS